MVKKKLAILAAEDIEKKKKDEAEENAKNVTAKDVADKFGVQLTTNDTGRKTTPGVNPVNNVVNATKQKVQALYQQKVADLVSRATAYAKQGSDYTLDLANSIINGAITSPGKGNTGKLDIDAIHDMTKANSEISRALSESGIFNIREIATNPVYAHLATQDYRTSLLPVLQDELTASLEADKANDAAVAEYESALRTLRADYTKQAETAAQWKDFFSLVGEEATLEDKLRAAGIATGETYDRSVFAGMDKYSAYAKKKELDDWYASLDAAALSAAPVVEEPEAPKYDSKTAGIQDEISTLEKYLNAHQKLEELTAYARSNPDFATASAYTAPDYSSLSAWEQFLMPQIGGAYADNALYTYINTGDVDPYFSQSTESADYYKQWEELGYDYMLDQDKEIWNVLRTMDPAKADEYLQALSQIYLLPTRAQGYRSWDETVATNGLTAVPAWIGSVGRGIDNILSVPQQMAETWAGVDNPYSAAFDSLNRQGYTRGAQLGAIQEAEMPEWMKTVAEYAYQGVSGAADNTARLLATGMNPTAALIAAGLQSASGSLHESSERDDVSGAAKIVKAIGAGAIEVGTEKIGLDALFDKGKSGALQYLKGVVLSEMGEETLNALSEPALEAVVAYLFDHEAEIKSGPEFFKDLTDTAITTAISSLLMGGGGAINQTITNRQTGKTVTEQGDPERMVEIAKAMDPNSEVYQIATEIETSTKKGQKIPLGKLGRLTQEMGKVLGEQYADLTNGVMNDAIANRLVEVGSTPEKARRNADAIRKIGYGLKVTVQERAGLIWDKYADQVAREVAQGMHTITKGVNNLHKGVETIKQGVRDAVNGITERSNNSKAVNEDVWGNQLSDSTDMSKEGAGLDSGWVEDAKQRQQEQAADVMKRSVGFSEALRKRNDVPTVVQEAVKRGGEKVRKGKNGEAVGKENSFHISYDIGDSKTGEGELQRVKRSEDGQMQLVIKDGNKEVEVDIDSYTTVDGEGTATLIEAIKHIDDNLHHVSDEEANAMLQSYKAQGGDAARFVESYETLYLRGYSGVADDTNLPATDLDGTLAKIAVDSGKRQAEKDEQQRKERASDYKAVENPTVGWLGRVDSNAQVKGQGDAQGLEGALESLTEVQRMTAEASIAFGKAVGLNVVLFESDPDHVQDLQNGSFDESTHTVYLDVNAGAGSGMDVQTQKNNGTLGYAMMRTMSHELTHYLEVASPEMYAKYKAAVRAGLKAAGKETDMAVLIREKIDRALNAGRKMSYKAAEAEVIADASEYMLKDSKFTNDLDPTLKGKIKSFLQNFAQKVKEIFNHLTGSHKESAALREMKDGVYHYMEGLQDLWDAGFDEIMAKGTGEQSSGATEMVEGQDVKYSPRDMADIDIGQMTLEDGRNNLKYVKQLLVRNDRSENHMYVPIAGSLNEGFLEVVKQPDLPVVMQVAKGMQAMAPETYRINGGHGHNLTPTEVINSIEDLSADTDVYYNDSKDRWAAVTETESGKTVVLFFDFGQHINPDSLYGLKTKGDHVLVTAFTRDDVDDAYHYLDNGGYEKTPATEAAGARSSPSHAEQVFNNSVPQPAANVNPDVKNSDRDKAIAHLEDDGYMERPLPVEAEGGIAPVHTKEAVTYSVPQQTANVNPDVKFSERDLPTEVSIRELLESAGDDAASTIEEKNALQIYRDKLNVYHEATTEVEAAETALKAVRTMAEDAEREGTADTKSKGAIKAEWIPKIEKAERRVETARVKQRQAYNKLVAIEETPHVQSVFGWARQFLTESLAGTPEEIEARQAETDKVLAELEKQYEDLKAAGRTQAASESKRRAELYRRMSKAFRSDAAAELKAAKAEFMERQKENTARRHQSDKNNQIEKRIIRMVKYLDNLIRNETDQKNIPEGFKPVVEAMMRLFINAEGIQVWGSIDSDKGAAAVTRAYLIYEQLKETDGEDLNQMADAYDEDVSESLKDLAIQLDKLNEDSGLSGLERLKFKESVLQNIDDIVQSIYHLAQTIDNVRINEQNASLTKIASGIREQLEKKQNHKQLAGKAGEIITPIKNAIGYGNMTPVYFFRKLGLKSLSVLANDLFAGETKYGILFNKVKADLRGILAKHNYWAWRDDAPLTLETDQAKAAVEVAEGGKKKKEAQETHTITISKLEAMVLWAVWNREHTGDALIQTQHLEKGGFVFGEMRVNGIWAENETTPHKLTNQDMKKIEAYLTKEQKAFADEIVYYMTNLGATLGNETSLELFGIKKFKDGYYFPIQVAKGQLAQKSDAGKGATDDSRIKHMPSSRRRLNKAAKPIVVGDFLDIATQHMEQMLRYHCFAIPIENMNRVLNMAYIDDTGSRRTIREMIGQKYGVEAQRYLERYIADLNGGIKSDSVEKGLAKFVSLFKKGAVAASLGVAIQQPTSIIRATMEIHPKYFIPFMGKETNVNIGEEWEQLTQYSGVAVLKELGGIDMTKSQGMAKVLAGNLEDDFKWYQKLKLAFGMGAPKGQGAEAAWRQWENAFGFLAGKADQIAWTWMWRASKAETHDLHPEMDVNSQEFLELAAHRFDEVMRLTQVYDSTLARSQNMRSDTQFMKMMTSFAAEGTLTANMLADAFSGKSKGRKAKAAVVFVTSSIVTAAAAALVKAGRDDDDEKTWAEKYLDSMGGTLGGWSGSLNPLSTLPVVRDMMSLLDGYDIERSDMSLLTDLVKEAQKLVDGKYEDNPMKGVENVSGVLANMFGVPAKNIMRDLRSLYNTATGLLNPPRETNKMVLKNDALENFTYNLVFQPDTSTEAYYKKLYDATVKGDEQLQEDLKEYLGILGKDDKAIKTGVRKVVKEKFLDGDLTEEQAKKILLDNGWADDEKKAFTYVDEWRESIGNEDDEAYNHSVYNTVYEAALKEDNAGIKTAVDELVKNGWEEKKVRSQLRTHINEQYMDGAITQAQVKSIYKKYCLPDDFDKDDSNEWYWLFKKLDYGKANGGSTEGWSNYNALKEAFATGNKSKIWDAWRELAAHGYKENTVTSYVRTNIIKQMLLDGDITTAQATSMLRTYASYEKDSDNVDKPKEWLANKK